MMDAANGQWLYKEFFGVIHIVTATSQGSAHLEQSGNAISNSTVIENLLSHRFVAVRCKPSFAEDWADRAIHLQSEHW